jgi:hypothetical protein
VKKVILEKTDTQKETPTEQQVKKYSSEIWKLWLIVAFFAIMSIGSCIEKNSPEGRENTKQQYENAIKNVYTETFDACEGMMNETECREEASSAADIARRHLGPALGQ